MIVAPVPVVDMTGLKGRYQLDLEISWSEMSAAASDSSRDPAFDPAFSAAQLNEFQHALQKAGLRLSQRKGPVETVAVDQVEKTPTEN